MHVTRYKTRRSKWVEISINEDELKSLNEYINNSFAKDENNDLILLKDKGYWEIDDFYKAKGSYSCFKTCNTWANSGFKESKLKACFWTPFDFGLLWKYE